MKLHSLETLRSELPGITWLLLLSVASAVFYAVVCHPRISLVYPSVHPRGGSVMIESESLAREPVTDAPVQAASESSRSLQMDKSVSESIDLATMQVLREQDAALVVDARSRFHFRRGHIPKSINIPWNDFKGAYHRAGLPPAHLAGVIIVYCGSKTCNDSLVVADQLRALGYRSVTVFSGGVQEWEGANLPLAKSE